MKLQYRERKDMAEIERRAVDAGPPPMVRKLPVDLSTICM